MLPKITHQYTNWIDGMKISRQHFIDTENANIDLIRDSNAISLTPLDYGLLMPEPGEKSSLDCNILLSQSKNFKISVRVCRAVTMGGCRIEIVPGVTPELVSENDIFSDIINYDKTNTTSLLAIICANPFDRQPSGMPDAEEYPPRNPFAVSNIRLALISEESFNTSVAGAWSIPIARFRIKNEELVRDANYIPPCAVIAAHPGTKQIYNTVVEHLIKIQENSIEIVKKVISGAQNQALPQNVKKLCENNMWHISNQYFMFRTMFRNQSPVYLANTVVQLAGMINTQLNIFPEKEKEELLQYFTHWNEIHPGEFEKNLGHVIDSDYNHENISEYFGPLIQFLKMWADLLDKLKELKLIGQKNEKFDFGGRTMETTKNKEKGKFSIFD